MARKPADPDQPLEHPWGEIFTWMALAPVFLGSWWQTGHGFFWPIFPIGAWGLSLYRKVTAVNRHNEQLRLRTGLSPALPAPPVVAAPVPEPTPARPLPGGASAETAGPLVPEALRPLVQEANRVADALVASGRGQVAEGLEVGIREAIRLTHLRAQIGDIDVALAEARAESDHLAGQVARATDPEARASWQQSAEAVARRIEKIEAMRTTDERAAARVESFRQLVKSLAVDVTRRDLTELEDATSLAELADQAHRVDREVEALHHTNDELRALSSTRRLQGA